MQQIQSFPTPGSSDGQGSEALRAALGRIVGTLSAYPRQAHLSVELLENLRAFGPLPTPTGTAGQDMNIQTLIARLNQALSLMPVVAGVGSLDAEWAEVLGSEIRDLVNRLDAHAERALAEAAERTDAGSRSLDRHAETAVPMTADEDKTVVMSALKAPPTPITASRARSDQVSQAEPPAASNDTPPGNAKTVETLEKTGNASAPRRSAPFTGPIPAILRRPQEGEPSEGANEDLAIPPPSGRPLPPLPSTPRRFRFPALVLAVVLIAVLLGRIAFIALEPKPDGASETPSTPTDQSGLGTVASVEKVLDRAEPDVPPVVEDRVVESAPPIQTAPEEVAPTPARPAPTGNLLDQVAPPPGVAASNPALPVTPTVKPTPPSAPTGSLTSSFAAQIGSYKSQESAEQGWADFTARDRANAANLSRDIERADLGAAGIYYRLKVGPFANREAASAFCARVSAGGRSCITVVPAAR